MYRPEGFVSSTTVGRTAGIWGTQCDRVSLWRGQTALRLKFSDGTVARNQRKVAIHVCVLTMNLWKRLKELLFAFLRRTLQAAICCRRLAVMSLLAVFNVVVCAEVGIVQ